jgi:hypothetical protein
MPSHIAWLRLGREGRHSDTEDIWQQSAHRRRHQSRHLDDAVASLQLCLDEAEVRELEQPYTPRLPECF